MRDLSVHRVIEAISAGRAAPAGTQTAIRGVLPPRISCPIGCILPPRISCPIGCILHRTAGCDGSARCALVDPPRVRRVESAA